MDEEQRSRLDRDRIKVDELLERERIKADELHGDRTKSQPPVIRAPRLATWLNLLLALGFPFLGFAIARVPGLIVGALIGLGLLLALNRRAS
jgi:hypothetical protein